MDTKTRHDYVLAPGPWAVTESGDMVTSEAPGFGPNIVCEAPDRKYSSREYWPGNAALIAAAPDLLQIAFDYEWRWAADYIHPDSALAVQHLTEEGREEWRKVRTIIASATRNVFCAGWGQDWCRDCDQAIEPTQRKITVGDSAYHADTCGPAPDQSDVQ